MNEIYDEPWKQELKALIDKAKKEGKWLRCGYQDIWMSPAMLEQSHREGRMMWGVVNWTLEDPNKRLKQAEEKVERAIKERNAIAASML